MSVKEYVCMCFLCLCVKIWYSRYMPSYRYMYTYIHACTHTHINTYIHNIHTTYTHTHTHIHTHTCINTHTNTSTHQARAGSLNIRVVDRRHGPRGIRTAVQWVSATHFVHEASYGGGDHVRQATGTISEYSDDGERWELDRWVVCSCVCVCACV